MQLPASTNGARAARKRSVLLRGKAPGPLLSHPVSLYASWTIAQSHFEAWNGGLCVFRITTHCVNPNVLPHPGIGTFSGSVQSGLTVYSRTASACASLKFLKRAHTCYNFFFCIMTVVLFTNIYDYFAISLTSYKGLWDQVKKKKNRRQRQTLTFCFENSGHIKWSKGVSALSTEGCKQSIIKRAKLPLLLLIWQT